METTMHPDAELITRLGGPAELARKLGIDPRSGGTQRVQNWKYRGIPEIWLLRRPDIFGAGKAKPKRQRAKAAA